MDTKDVTKNNNQHQQHNSPKNKTKSKTNTTFLAEQRVDLLAFLQAQAQTSSAAISSGSGSSSLLLPIPGLTTFPFFVAATGETRAGAEGGGVGEGGGGTGGKPGFTAGAGTGQPVQGRGQHSRPKQVQIRREEILELMRQAIQVEQTSKDERPIYAASTHLRRARRKREGQGSARRENLLALYHYLAQGICTTEELVALTGCPTRTIRSYRQYLLDYVLGQLAKKY